MVFTSFVTWSSMDTLTEGVWGVHILCNLVIHGYSDRGGVWGVHILCNLVIHGYSDRGGMGYVHLFNVHPLIL